MADERRRRQHPLLAAHADQSRQRRDAAGRLDLRLARRVQGLGDAEQPGRRRRRALRDDADAEGGGGRTRRPDARSGSSIRAAARRAARGSGIAASPCTRTACSSPTATSCGRSTGRPARRSPRSAPTAASICAKASACRAERASVSASTPGRDLRGPADHGQQRARDAARIAGTHPRVRREHRQAALDLPHHSAARRIRLRHVADGRALSSPAAPTPGPA